ncbi:LysM peptidoglycan-binding domain-containing protein [Kingella negevensis]|uniref:Murein hydrolase activator NlpD n=2 Tax=Kingella negevensis TaxID=1522312 RepID=A0A238TB41_9NEIS|nr:LysM peptidoglycan-binding domain-containing protein [Kingella negevensis]MDK4684581.1 LysM peptidoglycan-binding domain-containing protein [Kingella negevensis]MDK4696274.1 LysM peptidoglycan-binding domain-containing protein [Kingella negevensis]MDK4707711.1 LysM peptidoglycan-binding domain-containing protein [Kingella negevensis]MDK4709853.1 LysM peptidoglycan-binding domain-containing protein [Kingella negevensis]SNB60973.1 Murein hydrolase activator NlpD precursor [Kingella negevensis
MNNKQTSRLFSASAVLILTACATPTAAPIFSGTAAPVTAATSTAAPAINNTHSTTQSKTPATNTTTVKDSVNIDLNNPYGAVVTDLNEELDTSKAEVSEKIKSMQAEVKSELKEPLNQQKETIKSTTETVYQPSNTNNTGLLKTAYHPSNATVNPNAATHSVVSGDTVYNISKRYGISQDDLRAWNNLSDNNISVGQVLKVKPASTSKKATTSSTQTSASGTSHVVVADDTLYNISKRYKVSVNQLREWNNLPSDTVKLGQVLQVGSSTNKYANVTSKSTKTQTTKITSTPSTYTSPNPSITETVTRSEVTKTYSSSTQSASNVSTQSKNGINWQSPVSNGQIVKAYSAITRGIDLSTSSGQSVVAAADGEVVYSGIGPEGYGNLVVIKHSQNYSTNYSNVASLAVKEKAIVKRGQKVATMGSNPLHFEVRLDGSPVNPNSFVNIK